MALGMALLAIAAAGECLGSAAAKPQELPMKLIDKELLRGCLDGSMQVVLARVTSASIELQGTRSRRSVCEVAVVERVCGDPGGSLTLWRYTAEAEPHLRKGGTYVLAVALPAGAMLAPGSMIKGPANAVEVQPGEEGRAVEAHREALAALRAAGR
jgi:hypothetical protein